MSGLEPVSSLGKALSVLSSGETVGWAVGGAAVGFTMGLLQFLSATALRVSIYCVIISVTATVKLQYKLA